MTPSYGGKARVVEGPAGVVLCASDNVPVREKACLPAKLLTAADGKKVLDFGQNIAGYLAFTVRGKKGTAFRLVCGEVLDKDGHVDLSGIQETRPEKGWNQMSLVTKLMGGQLKGNVVCTPLQEIRFQCPGREDHYKTSFAVFGFRYVQIEGDIEINPANFTAIACLL